MSLSIGNRLSGIIPRGALAQVKSSAESTESFSATRETPTDQTLLQHGRARDLAGFMPPASWQVLSYAAENPDAPKARQINGSYGFVAESNRRHATHRLASAV
ncbi:MAG: hypothetical protein EPN26_14570 [Rhodospirillales bacterium]|nr:MAG: hypothetical protein EPN26_14570 [Rhodospirillales bacterium]